MIQSLQGVYYLSDHSRVYLSNEYEEAVMYHFINGSRKNGVVGDGIFGQ